jgi:hypothetical protein
MKVDDIWAVAAKKSTIDTHTGNIRSTVFSSSTWDTVQSLHGLIDPFSPSPEDGATMAALSRNLDRNSCDYIYHQAFGSIISFM